MHSSIRGILAILCFGFMFLTVTAGAGHAAAPTAAGAAVVTVAADVDITAVVAQEAGTQGAGGLPERSAPPRTLRAHWHVYIAFAITWALLFGFVLSLGRRFGRLEDEIRRLRGPD